MLSHSIEAVMHYYIVKVGGQFVGDFGHLKMDKESAYRFNSKKKADRFTRLWAAGEPGMDCTTLGPFMEDA